MQRYPEESASDETLIRQVETAKDVISKVRDLRNQNQIKPKQELKMSVQNSDSAAALFAGAGLREMIVKLAVLSALEPTGAEPANCKSFVSGTEKYFVEFEQEIDVAAECARVKQELEYQRGFLKSVDAKLANERFVSGAPAEVVEGERKKRADALARIEMLEESQAKLGC